MPNNSEIRRNFLQIAADRKLSAGTIYRYRRWIKKFIVFHDGVALDQVDEDDIAEFYTSLSRYSESTRHQAKNAIDFLYSNVLKRPPLPGPSSKKQLFNQKSRYCWWRWKKN